MMMRGHPFLFPVPFPFPSLAIDAIYLSIYTLCFVARLVSSAVLVMSASVLTWGLFMSIFFDEYFANAKRCDANYLNFRAPRVTAKDHKMNGLQVVFASITG